MNSRHGTPWTVTECECCGMKSAWVKAWLNYPQGPTDHNRIRCFRCRIGCDARSSCKAVLV